MPARALHAPLDQPPRPPDEAHEARGQARRGQVRGDQLDEAIDTIADQLKYTIDTYGNEAIYIIYATGMYSCTGKQPGFRLLSLLGGFVNQGYDYSTHMLQAIMPFMYGSAANLDDDGNHVTLGKPATAFSPYDATNASSFSEAERASDLVVMFGNSPAETRMGGANAVWDFAKVREAVQGRGGRIINIDYRLNESASGHPDEWLPIRTGTDAALCSAIAHEWIANGQVDKEFLDAYCVGYDEDTMPESAKGRTSPTRTTSWAPATTWWKRPPSGPPPSRRFRPRPSARWRPR